MKHFRCGDVVPNCTASFSGTEEQILQRVAEHARHDHGMADIPGELVASVRANLVAV